MWIFSFYRLYFSTITGAAFYFLLFKNLWLAICIAVCTRIIIGIIENAIANLQIDSAFKKHQHLFRQQFGPYGIRIINKAESDKRIKKSLAGVFTSNRNVLKKNVEQLEVMDMLFKSGMRPDGDEYLLHDLKLKYGKQRLDSIPQ
jgi:hypothetical protein